MIDMIIKKLEQAHRARPFRPFLIHLADGRDITVTHPELMAVSPKDRYAVVLVPTEGFEVVELPRVTGLSLPRRVKG